MASDRKLNIYNEDNVTINVVEESDNQLTIINESPTVEVITIYEQGPQGPRGEKGDTTVLPTEIISGSGANNLLALFVSGGYITGSNSLSFDGSNLSISGSVYISTFSGSAVSLAGISQDNNLTNITIGSGLNLLDNTLNAVGSLTGTGSITQVAFWTASKAISGSQNLVYDYTNNRLGINNSNPQYALDVSGTVHLSGSLINVSHIDFSTSSYSTNAPARITWNPDFGTLDLGVVGGNVNLSWGLEVAAYVVNGEADTLVDGEVVYMSGSRGDKPKVYRASSVTELTSTKTFGVVTEPIPSNQLGYVTTQGVVNGLDLSSFNPGDAVWLGTTPGTFTATKPQAPTHSVFVGIVQRANAGAGQLYVRVQNGYEIDELHNVRITNPLNGQLLTYNQAQHIWVNGNTLSGSYFVSGSIQATAFTGSSGLFNDLYITGSSNSALLVIDSPASQNIICVSGSGNVGFGTNNPVYKVDVIGNGRFRGSGTTSATTAFRVENNSAAAAMVITDDRRIFFGGAANLGANINYNGTLAGGNLVLGYDTTQSPYIYGYDGASQAIALATNGSVVNSGVVVGSRTKQASAMFEVISTTKGFLTPRMTLAQRNAISAPAQGLIVYVTSSADEGIYYYNSIPYQGWTRLLNSSGSQTLTGSLDILGTLNTSVYSGSSAYISGDVYVGGKVTAQEFYTQYVSSSIIYQSGSTKFGDSLDDIHQRTGSMQITGSVNIAGNLNSTGDTLLTIGTATSFKIQGALGGALAYTYAENIGGVYTSGLWTAGNMSFRSGISSRLYITNTNLPQGITLFGNNLGLNVLTPTAKLHVSESSNSGLFKIDSDSAQNIIYVSGSGNVGIGTIGSSAYKLDVSGSTRSSDGYYVGNNGTGYGLGSTQNGTYVIALAHSNGVYGIIRNVYYPMIGFQNNADIRLFNAEEVRYQSRLNSNQTSVVFYDNTTKNYNWFRNKTGIGGADSVPNATLHISGSSGSGLFEIDSDSVQNIIYVSGSGNVGIGTNTPAFKLDVTAPSRIHSMYIGQGLGSGNVYMGESVGGQAGSLMDQNVFIGALAGRSFAGNANGNTAVGYNALKGGNNAEYNTAVGHFALGNNSAGQYSVAVGAFAGNDATSGPNTFIGYNTGRGITTGTGNTIIGSNVTGLSSTLSNTVIIADSSGNRRINVDSNGNTSLGVVSASARLHVNSSGTTSATYGLQIHNATGTNNGLVVRDDGRVGIGTNNPAYTLDVVGSGDFSGGLTVTGSFQLSGSLFQYSDNTDVDIGTEVVTSVPTSSYRSAFFDYVISSGSNARAGTVFSVWGGSSVEYTETSTNDIGSTTPVSLFVALNGANIELRATTTADNWSVKSLARML